MKYVYGHLDECVPYFYLFLLDNSFYHLHIVIIICNVFNLFQSFKAFVCVLY